MKKILYFLIGFFISLLFYLPYLYPENLYDISNPTWSDYCTSNPDTIMHYVGQYASQGDASQAVYDATGSSPSLFHLRLNGDIVAYGYAEIRQESGEWHVYYAIYLIHGDYIDLAYDGSLLPVDSDDDGLPDSIDAYPNDIKTYQFQILSKYYDIFGEQVGVLIKTDYGDTILLGTDLGALSNDLGTGSVTEVSVNDGLWYDSQNIVEDQDLIPLDLGGQPQYVPDTTVPKISNPTNPSPDQDDKMDKGTPSTGTESDADQKIIDNTQAIANNTSRLGDYLKSINSNIQGLNSDTTITNNAVRNYITNYDSGDPGEDPSPPEDLSSAVTALQGAAQDTDAQTAIDALKQSLETLPTIDDVPSYVDTEHEGIATSWWDFSTMIADLIAQNPITDALLGIEVDAVGNCSFDYVWVGKTGISHNITFSLCNFKDQLNVFGQILLMIVNFNAIFLLFRKS
jgi:hypothetical protein